jgi:hypothetical protein
MAGPVESLLERARKRIEAPERWTQGADARRDDRMAVGAADKGAVCWCAEGSLLSEAGPDMRAPLNESIRIMFEAADCGSVIDFNDAPDRTHAEVLAAFDRAIALARERGL